MSSQPFGLSENPFTAAHELTVEEATLLVHHRVTAAGGDAATLFPAETCAELHRFARGKRGGVFALAGRAMRIADHEGASSITTEHVQAAVAEAGREAAVTSEPSATVEPQQAQPPPEADPSSSGAFMLPTAPSENLDPDAREWVGRFISTSAAQTPWPAPAAESKPALVAESKPAPVAESKPAAAPAKAPAPPDAPKPATVAVTVTPRASARLVASKHAPPPAPSAPAPASPAPTAAPQLSARRSARSWPTSRRGRRNRRGMSQWIIGGTATIAIGFVILHLLPRAEKPALRPVAPAAEVAPASGSVPAATTVPASGATSPASSRGRKTAKERAAAATESSAPRVTGTQEREKPPAVTERLAIEVATFMFEDRAQSERERLGAAGQLARVMTGSENGAPLYRVIVGSFRSRTEAERAADALLAGGLVQQARIVTLANDE